MTLSHGSTHPQSIHIYDWQTDTNDPIAETPELPEDIQTFCIFNMNKVNEISTNGSDRILFWYWNEGDKEFDFYSPGIPTDFPKVEEFTQTAFIPGKSQAVSAASGGHVVVWDLSYIIDGTSPPDERRAIKVIKLTPDDPINVLMVQNNHLVAGCDKGTVKFFDLQYKIEAWFEGINLDRVMSISFSDTEEKPCIDTNKPKIDAKGNEEQNSFKCSNFIIATETGSIFQLKSTLYMEFEPDKKKGVQLLKGHSSRVLALATHPSKPLLAIGGYRGFLTMWNYATKENIWENDKYISEKKGPTTLGFPPDGLCLIAGFDNQYIYFFNVNDGSRFQTEIKLSDNSNKKNTGIPKQLVFSQDSKYMAVRDDAHCVSLFKYDHLEGNPALKIEWGFAGKCKAHVLKITGITFVSYKKGNEIIHKLFSVGMDRRLVEYDIYGSTEFSGLPVLKMIEIEQEAYPTSIINYPYAFRNKILMLTSNSEYKLKLWDVEKKKCLQTCLGPTYGGPISILKMLTFPESENEEIYLAYATDEKVMGLIKLPADGNPNKTMGLIGHPKKIGDICVSFDGKHMFTCGGIQKATLEDANPGLVQKFTASKMLE